MPHRAKDDKKPTMMKPYLLALIFFSCSKEQVEKPVEPEPISFTQIREMYNDKGQHDSTLLVIHIHRVDDPKLIAQYKEQLPVKPMCDEIVNNDTMYTFISKPCQDLNHKN